MAEIKVYTTQTCPWCMKLKVWMKQRGVTYSEVDVSEDSEAAEYMMSKSGEIGVPQTEINGKMIVGFAPEEIEAELAKMKKPGKK